MTCKGWYGTRVLAVIWPHALRLYALISVVVTVARPHALAPDAIPMHQRLYRYRRVITSSICDVFHCHPVFTHQYLLYFHSIARSLVTVTAKPSRAVQTAHVQLGIRCDGTRSQLARAQEPQTCGSSIHCASVYVVTRKELRASCVVQKRPVIYWHLTLRSLR